MSDVLQLHNRTCRSSQRVPVLDMSIDGVQECKSSSLSADIYSVSFKNCRTVYPIRIIRPINKYKIDDQYHLKEVIDDLNHNLCQLRNAIFDNPKRACARCGLIHSASFAYEYCESKAEYICEDNTNKGKGHLAWPFCTHNGTLRTIERIVEITQRIANCEILSRDEAKGFWGTSHFLTQENFDFIQNIPAEYMHSGCLGVVKRLVELTFNVGANRKRNTNRKLSDVSLFNQLISKIKSTREFSRRLRNLDFGVMKAQEFRNIGLFYFILVLECIPPKFSKERKVWMYLAFILRSCILTNREFDLISKNLIKKCALSFYKLYESVYGKCNCSYSIHIIACHILQIRGDEPLTEKSAFKYENFYSELRNLFQPGTISPSKQILQNCYMKRQLEPHNCEKSIFFDIEKDGKENNSLVYYLDDDNEYQFLT